MACVASRSAGTGILNALVSAMPLDGEQAVIATIRDRDARSRGAVLRTFPLAPWVIALQRQSQSVLGTCEPPEWTPRWAGHELNGLALGDRDVTRRV